MPQAATFAAQILLVVSVSQALAGVLVCLVGVSREQHAVTAAGLGLALGSLAPLAAWAGLTFT